MDTKGGRFSIAVNGAVFSGRGAAKINPARAVPTTGVNMDGTGYKTVAPKLAGIELSFDRGIGFKWDADMILQDVDVTFIETDFGIMHMFTKASWNGDPQIDSATGEVSGMSLTSSQYQQVATS